jgi:5'-3' exonuclease
MKQKELFKLLDGIQEQGEETVQSDRILFIDGLNLFFRNFAVMNMVNPDGVHIGGLGGFFRSLGAMIRQIDPTQVYVVFDGAGSANNRKNINPLYKSGRDLQRITNWDAFDDKQDEDDSKVDQMVRVIQYLKTLPVKTVSIDKVEADDIISYLCNKVINKPEDKAFIVSSDKDFIQLVNDNVIVYRPMEKEYYTEQTVIDKYKMSPKNFILHKTLLGDNSDKIKGIKGLGEKGLYKKFPELMERDMDLKDIFTICEAKFKDHVVYARVLQNMDEMENNYKIMNLENPMISNKEKEYLNKVVNSEIPPYIPEQFVAFYNQDKLGGMIRNVEFWVKDIFEKLVINK